MKIEIISDQELRKGSPFAAGLDVKTVKEPKIVGKTFGDTNYWSAIDYIEYDTGIKIKPEDGKHTLLLPRSSASKYNLLLANSVGLIDWDYRGTLLFRFKYVFQPEDLVLINDASSQNSPDKMPIIVGKVNYSKIYRLNDYIGQIVGAETQKIELDHVLFLDETERGSGGFGHSDLKK